MMKLSVAERPGENAIVIGLSGELVFGPASVQLRDAVHRGLDAGFRRFVINLGGISFIDSAGLGELVSVYSTVRNRSGDLKLANPASRVRALLEVTRLQTVFDCYDEEADAIDAFRRL